MLERSAVVIEDDDDIAMLVHRSLSGAGFDVARASDGLSGIDAVREVQPDVVTLDIGLPGIDGLETTRRLREFSDAHIIMLTAHNDEADLLMGLDAGADDYITKPFSPRELRARVNAIMRRREAQAPRPAADDTATASPTHILRHNGAVVNVDERTVVVDEQPIVLTRTEFDLFTAVVESRGRVVEKSELVRVARDDEGRHDSYVSNADRRAVEVHIGNLRRKLGENAANPRWILTVRGVGYRLTATAPTA